LEVSRQHAKAASRGDTLPSWFSIHGPEKTKTVWVRDNLAIGASAGTFIETLRGGEQIYLMINSSGGCMAGEVQIYNVLCGRVTEAKIFGRCYSSAVVLALAGERRVMDDNARLLVHAPVSAVLGGVDEHLMAARGLRKLKAEVARILHERTGQPIATIRKWLSTDTYFDARQALAAGLVNEVIPACPPVELPAVKPVDPEEIFWRTLDKLKLLHVKSKAKFFRELSVWETYQVK
jgi:ATP-dependent Clp protease, protease subunit